VASREGEIAQSEEVGGAMLRLRKFMFTRVYLGPEARGEHERVERTVRGLFEYFLERPEELPGGDGHGDGDQTQRVVDYLAGMTDRYCIATFRRLALPEESRL
jgi:dGTPase